MQVFLLLFLIQMSTGKQQIEAVPVPNMLVCEAMREEVIAARPQIKGVNYNVSCITTRDTTEKGV